MRQEFRTVAMILSIGTMSACTSSSDGVQWLDRELDLAVQCMSSTPGESRRDSAGIEIVEHNVELGKFQVLRPTSVARIDSRHPTAFEPFGLAMGVAASNGNIFVADSLTSEIFMFDSVGQFIRRIGRQGEGPGDYRRLGGVFLLSPDTVAVTDQKGSRMTLMGPDGEVLRVARIRGIQWDGDPYRTTDAMPGLSSLVGRFDDGTFLNRQNFIQGHLPPDLEPGRPVARYNLARLLRLDTSATASETIREFRTNADVIHPGDGGFSWSPLLFSQGESFAGSRAHYWHTDGVRYQIDRYNLDGELVRSIRVCRAPQEVTMPDVEREWAALGEEEPELYSGPMDPGTPVRGWFPAWRLQPFTGDGLLWAEEFAPRGSPRQWWVFDTTGSLVASMEMPAGRVVDEIGNRRIVTIVGGGRYDEHLEIFRVPDQLQAAGNPEPRH